jgi:hypothetical protein
MGAPSDNKFWLLRSKHGKDKLFTTPELMWEAACEYFEWCDNNPFHETKPMSVSLGQGGGSSVEMVIIPIKRPFTLQGLCLYLDCSSSYFRSFKSTIKPEDKDYLTIIEKIEETIYDQKFSGAAAGFFNANIISRDLGLADKREEKVTNINYNTDLSKDEIRDINKALEKEF